MSQIHVLNNLLDKKYKKDYYLYMLESHGELTLILEHKGSLVYAEILGIMITQNTGTKAVIEIVQKTKDYIDEVTNNN